MGSKRLITFEDLAEIGEGRAGDWFCFITKLGEKVFFEKGFEENGGIYFKCHGKIPKELSSLDDVSVEDNSIVFPQNIVSVKIEFSYTNGFGTEQNPYIMAIA